MSRYLRNLIIILIVLGVLYGLDVVFQGRLISPYFTRIIMLSGIAITLAVSLNLINGFTGQFSIGHAGFMAVGAYSSAYFSVNYGMRLAESLGGGKLGWIVALACYPPFWPAVSFYLRYDTGYAWGAWLAYHPYLYVVWGTAILALEAVYVWATVIFGAHFSNLTNRGIITNGPYRFTKHPAYIAKNLTWWMIAVPFLPRDNLWDTLPRCAMLLGVNFIYYMRAKTEEWHLARDPDYVRYALWIEEHGLLRFLRRVPVVRRLGFRAPVDRPAQI